MAQRADLTYIGREEAQRVFAATDSASQPQMLEPLAQRIAGQGHDSILIDRFSLSPGPDFVRALLPGARFASRAPGMFAAYRDLPIITGSGVDPRILRKCSAPIS